MHNPNLACSTSEEGPVLGGPSILFRTCSSRGAIKWPNIPPDLQNKSAKTLIMKAIKPFLDALNEDFDKGFQKLLEYDDFSFRFYITSTMPQYNSYVLDFLCDDDFFDSMQFRKVKFSEYAELFYFGTLK
ncbi:hypothetical protein B0H14DRAFT_2615218 [Mycena olivaceomarginata]|nr:hypothetical protein B0H14DRAFT_2615218 [Mycena olivaceomarginata]